MHLGGACNLVSLFVLAALAACVAPGTTPRAAPRAGDVGVAGACARRAATAVEHPRQMIQADAGGSFDIDGELVAIATSGGVDVWDLASRARLRRLTPRGLGDTIASGGDVAFDDAHHAVLTRQQLVPLDGSPPRAAPGRAHLTRLRGGGRARWVDDYGHAFDAELAPLASVAHPLVDALASPDTDRNADGTIQLTELVDEVQDRVRRATLGRQTPWVTRREIFGDFAVARVRR